MKKEDWEKAKSRLRAPLGQVDLLCDGYSVTLVNECISMFRNGIAVYVNGEIRGSWFVQDCEERRRFIPQKETSLMSRKQIAAYNKMPKKDRGLLKKFREKTFTAYQTHWTNWQALVKHQGHPAKLSDKGRLLPGAGENRKETRPDIESLDERTALR